MVPVEDCSWQCVQNLAASPVVAWGLVQLHPHHHRRPPASSWPLQPCLQLLYGG